MSKQRTFQTLAIMVVVLVAIGVLGVWTVSAQGPQDDDDWMFGHGMIGDGHHGGRMGHDKLA